jgi:hypothetical protein
VSRGRRDDGANESGRIVRRATLYTLSFLAAGVAVAVIGAAFVAWLLRWAGQPFLRTWLVATALILLPGLLAGIWKLFRER